MVFYTLCISVFNLVLGYALAICLQSRGISFRWPGYDFVSGLLMPSHAPNEETLPDAGVGAHSTSKESASALASDSGTAANGEHASHAAASTLAVLPSCLRVEPAEFVAAETTEVI